MIIIIECILSTETKGEGKKKHSLLETPRVIGIIYHITKLLTFLIKPSGDNIDGNTREVNKKK